SKYAYGKDDHVVVKERLQQLVLFITKSFKPSRAKSFYDSGPVPEKTWAQRCGIGWQGKNTLIINRNGGSFYHIGIILTDLVVEPDQPETDHCGSCDLCVKTCPAGALNSPYQLEIAQCLSYQTIENKGDTPVDLKGKFRHRIYGCDICQDICPYNRFARPHAEKEFLPSPELKARRKKEWLALTEQEFNRLFGNSSVKRTGFHTLKRNMELAGETPVPAEH
nr:tRNA epoxyqueuosine(34) reductase QueG [Deltaproteobacteria bacterium]